jgi:hypothetical protein
MKPEIMITVIIIVELIVILYLNAYNEENGSNNLESQRL